MPLRSVVLGLTHFTGEQTGTQRGLSPRPRINKTEEKRSVGWRGVLLHQTWAQRQLVTLECACRGWHMLPRELPHLPGAACQAGHLLWSRASPSDSHLLLERPTPSGLQPVKKLQETDLTAPPAACSVPCLCEQPCWVFGSRSSWEPAGRGGGSMCPGSVRAGEEGACGSPGLLLRVWPLSSWADPVLCLPLCYSRPWDCRRSDQLTAWLVPPLRGPPTSQDWFPLLPGLGWAGPRIGQFSSPW